MSSCRALGQATEQLGLAAWPAAWFSSSQPQWPPDPLLGTTGKGDASAAHDADLDDARSVALWSYAQLLRLLPRCQACRTTAQHVRAALLGCNGVPVPAIQPQPLLDQDQRGTLPAPSFSDTAEPLTGAAVSPHAKLPEGRLEPGQGVAALSLLAACGQALRQDCAGAEPACPGGVEGWCSRSSSSSSQADECEAAVLRMWAAQLVLQLSGARGSAGTGKDGETCQMVGLGRPSVVGLLT